MKNKKRLSARTIIVIISALLVLCCTVGVTFAYIFDATDTITNIFNPGKVSCQVNEETWTDGSLIKENVKILNNGNTDAYIRCAIVINWQNEAGEVYGVAPKEGTDYSLSLNETDWVKGADGYYYHKKAVKYGTNSSTLINSCEVLKKAPAEGYTLSVEILASAVQSEPSTAVNDAWGATVSDGTLVPKS